MSGCVAPDCNNDRIGDSLHCIPCRNRFNPTYGKYKEIHRQVKHKLTEDIKALSVYDLLSLTSKIEIVYELRSTYRKLAFKTDYWDEGHNLVLISLLQTLEDIRTELHKRFNAPVLNNNEVEETEDVPDISIITEVKQSILTRESKETWPQSPEITANIKVNAELQRDIVWLVDKITTTFHYESPSHEFKMLCLLAFNQYRVLEYVRDHNIKQLNTLPSSLLEITRSQYQCLDHTQRIAVLKVAYSNLLQYKWLPKSIVLQDTWNQDIVNLENYIPQAKAVTRIRNSFIIKRIYSKLYYESAKPGIIPIYMTLKNGKIILDYSKDFDKTLISSLDRMQIHSQGVVNSNDASFVNDAANYDRDREELFKNGPISMKNLLAESREESRVYARKMKSLRKHK
jgi:hypothetical protein